MHTHCGPVAVADACDSHRTGVIWWLRAFAGIVLLLQHDVHPTDAHRLMAVGTCCPSRRAATGHASSHLQVCASARMSACIIGKPCALLTLQAANIATAFRRLGSLQAERRIPGAVLRGAAGFAILSMAKARLWSRDCVSDAQHSRPLNISACHIPSCPSAPFCAETHVAAPCHKLQSCFRLWKHSSSRAAHNSLSCKCAQVGLGWSCGAGTGLVVARREEDDSWSPPSALAALSAGWGLQARAPAAGLSEQTRWVAEPFGAHSTAVPESVSGPIPSAENVF